MSYIDSDCSTELITNGASARAAAWAFLASEPVRWNTLLTGLESLEGTDSSFRCWVTRSPDGQVVGVGLQRPVDGRLQIAVSGTSAIPSLAEAVQTDGPDSVEVVGEAQAVSRFARHWTELTGGTANPTETNRIYSSAN